MSMSSISLTLPKTLVKNVKRSETDKLIKVLYDSLYVDFCYIDKLYCSCHKINLNCDESSIYSLDWLKRKRKVTISSKRYTANVVNVLYQLG